MKLKKTKLFLSIFTVFLLGTSSSLFGQKFKEIDSVNYLQLPTENPQYINADVFVQVDQSAARGGISLGIGKLAGKKKGDSNVLDELVNNVFADEVVKYTTWSMFDGEISLAKGEGIFKVILVCTPDDNARPMAEPMKNGKGLHRFNYRTATKLKVFDANEKLLIEKDFGTINGVGFSKSWPKGATSVISVEGDDSTRHPYEVACIDGSLDHAKRVLYGLYGLKQFTVSQGVYTIKSQKESKNIYKKFETILEEKNKILLSDSQQKAMQECVDYWEGILDSVEEEEVWAVHYNLAVGYSWLLNETKSIANINKVKEMNAERFDHILNKSGSFRGKDLAVLEAYNSLEPFANYYAKGINLYPQIPALMDMDVYTMSHVMAINRLLANNLATPVALPIFPTDPSHTGMKKCDGLISKNGAEVMEFSYELKKGVMSAINIKSAKDSYLGKIKETVSVLDKSELHPSEMRRLHYSYEGNKVSGNYGITPELKFFLNDYSYKNSYVLLPFVNNTISKQLTSLESSGSITTIFTKADFVKASTVSGGEWFKTDFALGDSANVYIVSDNTTIVTEAMDIDASGIPAKYNVTYKMENMSAVVSANVKYKFGEETTKENSRKYAAHKKLVPVVNKLILDTVEKNGGVITGNTAGIADGKMELTKSYDVTSKIDSKGNWTEISIGDFTISRTIKY